MHRISMQDRLDIPDEPNWRFGKEKYESESIWRCWHKCSDKWAYIHTNHFEKDDTGNNITTYFCHRCMVLLPSKVNVIAKLLGVNKPK